MKEKGQGNYGEKVRKMAIALLVAVALMVVFSMLSGMLKGDPATVERADKAAGAGAAFTPPEAVRPVEPLGPPAPGVDEAGLAGAVAGAETVGAVDLQGPVEDEPAAGAVAGGYLAGADEDGEQSALPATGSMLAKVGIALGAVIALLLAARALFRKLSGAPAAVKDNGLVKVAAYTPLSQDRGVYTLRIGERVLIVGASDKGMSLLAEIPAGQMPEPEEEAVTAPSSFSTLLESCGGRRREGKAGGGSVGWIDSLRWRTARR